MHLVIGGSGFIGTRLCKRLTNANTKFAIIDKAVSKTFPEQTTVCDIRNKNDLLEIKTEASVIINLAAEHRDDVQDTSLYDQVNVDGARNVCQYAEKHNVKTIVFTSSVAIYGFAERNIDELGKINPFNDYGRTKYEAELVYTEWFNEDPANRTLIIVRPTVVFGEQNRGNVYNLLKQIASGKFVMIGNGENRKSMAYVENVAAFLEFSSKYQSGKYIYNYIDKPDFKMNELVSRVQKQLNAKSLLPFRLPYWLGITIGYGFDLVALILKRTFPISSIRIQKFCKDSIYKTSVETTDFVRPFNLEKAIEQTIRYEFIDKQKGEIFYSE